MERAWATVKGAMTEVAPFWMREVLESRHVKGHGKQQASQKQNNNIKKKSLTKVTKCSFTMWVVGLQSQDELTRPFWKALFNKERDGQVADSVPTNRKYSFELE
jgi:hypothetical protein